MLIGNVGKEPEVRYVEQGMPLSSFPLATSERGYTLQNGTQVPERTEWHNVVAWKKPAEYVEKYVHKGDTLYIEGQLRTRSYDDRNGITRYVTEVWANRVEVVSQRSPQPAPAPQPSATPTATTDNNTEKPPF